GRIKQHAVKWATSARQGASAGRINRALTFSLSPFGELGAKGTGELKWGDFNFGNKIRQARSAEIFDNKATIRTQLVPDSRIRPERISRNKGTRPTHHNEPFRPTAKPPSPARNHNHDVWAHKEGQRTGLLLCEKDSNLQPAGNHTFDHAVPTAPQH